MEHLVRAKLLSSALVIYQPTMIKILCWALSDKDTQTHSAFNEVRLRLSKNKYAVSLENKLKKLIHKSHMHVLIYIPDYFLITWH